MKLKSIMLAGAVACLPAASMAATVVTNGDTTTLGPGTFEFIFGVQTTGGAGSWSHTFDASNIGSGFASVTIGEIAYRGFSDSLTLNWYNAETGDLLSSTGFSPIQTALGTTFTPDALAQRFQLEWTNSPNPQEGRFFAFDGEGEINVVPAPAALPLLVAALGGLGLASRRKKAA